MERHLPAFSSQSADGSTSVPAALDLNVPVEPQHRVAELLLNTAAHVIGSHPVPKPDKV
jgi:hypothetical protein